MTYSPDTAAKAPALAGLTTRLRAAEDWLDAKGRGAWIAAMILGFVFVWPVGLALVVYMTYANKWSKRMFKNKLSASGRDYGFSRHTAWRSSGNSAFDAYKAETLRRLEEEQGAFESFLERLREAKDKQEFDSFMEDRAKGAARPPVPAQDAPRGEY
ncbi:DUF2852 domain-containing protein [Pseudorhodobacter sp. MZDSW-24AT]|uniref:DUF2852 domain-containing protein n=1 Tax=Pseudorhodobacter sp. MZDSW-24AT TaxID=2052957 RepID=UPI000C1F7C81|nr:DUF2852 domain-containing protein [Pseudorhodobacter sp. MZDSW-24AT]PJF10610.1 hypothetical protein CUR21_04555 [Pseudorhodobacter sp. MZDSW-24AT]